MGWSRRGSGRTEQELREAQNFVKHWPSRLDVLFEELMEGGIGVALRKDLLEKTGE
jgi:hypothetical protein